MSNKLSEVTIKNFQSLSDVTIPVGQFTAIIGGSNIGKSAVLRAMKTLARNASASGLVRQGTKELQIQATFDDGQVEVLTKGSKNNTFDLTQANGDTIHHAKAGATQVPDEIAKLWNAPDLAFMTQHDAPFMLADTPSEVARTIGELTNASMLMEAVREANRQRTEALAEVKARSREMDECRDEILTHAGLNKRGKALTDARGILEELKLVYYKRDELADLILQTEQVEQKLDEIVVYDTSMLTRLVAEVEQSTNKLTKLISYMRYIEAVDKELTQAQEVATNNTIKRSELETEIQNTMSEAGYCPYCGNGVI